MFFFKMASRVCRHPSLLPPYAAAAADTAAADGAAATATAAAADAQLKNEPGATPIKCFSFTSSDLFGQKQHKNTEKECKAKQCNTEQSKAKQNKAKQRKPKQCNAEQSNAMRSNAK